MKTFLELLNLNPIKSMIAYGGSDSGGGGGDDDIDPEDEPTNIYGERGRGNAPAPSRPAVAAPAPAPAVSRPSSSASQSPSRSVGMNNVDTSSGGDDKGGGGGGETGGSSGSSDGPQTETGRIIAESMARTAAAGPSTGTQVATLGPAAPMGGGGNGGGDSNAGDDYGTSGGFTLNRPAYQPTLPRPSGTTDSVLNDLRYGTNESSRVYSATPFDGLGGYLGDQFNRFGNYLGGYSAPTLQVLDVPPSPMPPPNRYGQGTRSDGRRDSVINDLRYGTDNGQGGSNNDGVYEANPLNNWNGLNNNQGTARPQTQGPLLTTPSVPSGQSGGSLGSGQDNNPNAGEGITLMGRGPAPMGTGFGSMYGSQINMGNDVPLTSGGRNIGNPVPMPEVPSGGTNPYGRAVPMPELIQDGQTQYGRPVQMPELGRGGTRPIDNQLITPKMPFPQYEGGTTDMFGNPYEDMPMGMSFNPTPPAEKVLSIPTEPFDPNIGPAPSGYDGAPIEMMNRLAQQQAAARNAVTTNDRSDLMPDGNPRTIAPVNTDPFQPMYYNPTASLGQDPNFGEAGASSGPVATSQSSAQAAAAQSQRGTAFGGFANAFGDLINKAVNTGPLFGLLPPSDPTPSAGNTSDRDEREAAQRRLLEQRGITVGQSGNLVPVGSPVQTPTDLSGTVDTPVDGEVVADGGGIPNADGVPQDTNNDGIVTAMEAEIAGLRAELSRLSGMPISETQGMTRDQIVTLINQSMKSYGGGGYMPLSYLNAFGASTTPNVGAPVLPSYVSQDGVYERRAVKDRETGETRYINVPISNASMLGSTGFQQRRRAGFGSNAFS